MNTQQQLDRMQHWLDTHPATPNPFTGPRILEDPDTLRRSRLSMAAARAQRRAPVITVDEYGWGSDGRYYPSRDGAW